MPPPSYKLQSSNGSEQWGWILDEPCTDRHVVENLLDGLIKQGLVPSGKDTGMSGVTRFVRLPNSVNTKASRIAENGGVAPRVHLTEWNPERRVSIESLAEPFAVNLQAERREGRVDGATDLPDHPMLDLANVVYVKQVLSEGRFDITCPWVNEHTDASDDGCAVFTNEDGSIGFKCHHGACEHRNTGDFIKYVEAQAPGFKEQLNYYKAMIEFKDVATGLPLAPALITTQPVPFTTKHPAVWPKPLSRDAMPGIIGEFIDEATNHSEADPAAVLAQFLNRFAIECGAKPHLKIGESRHSARENVVIVGDTSKGRKGTSAAPVEAVFKILDGSCRVSPGPLSSGEGIIYAVRDPVEEWRVNRNTNEGSLVITDPGVDDKRLLIIEEEFAASLQASKREGNTLSSIVRTLFDSGNAEPLTKSSRIKCTEAHVGITAHITLFELKKLLTENDKLNGFGNRFLWICSRRSKLVAFPEPLSDSIKQRMMAHLNKVIRKARESEL